AEKLGQRKGDLRLVASRGEEEDEYPAEPVSSALGADEMLGKRQEISLLKRALRELPDEKREVLVLSRLQSMKYEQIAELLGCEVGAVKVRVFRAIRALGQIYSQLSGEKAS
ncbi:MAG: sigma-70 family RNA polymerase sigma factor, partial [Acidobacteriaceae bacterium]|nr:sigma-70 family RNA polymerase sigma factor [Acidobacteriaceae bacterium]